MNYVLIRDGLMFDGCFDEQKEADDMALNNNKKYIGRWCVYPMTDKEFRKYMRSGILKPLANMELARGVRNLIR